jgi:hypothetical protein
MLACAGLLVGCGGGGPHATAPTPAPTAPAGSRVRVLLSSASFDRGVIALACWEPGSEGLWNGGGCLARLPAGAVIGVLGAQGPEPRTTTTRTQAQFCSAHGDSSSIETLGIAGEPLEHSAVATWPLGATGVERAHGDPDWETNPAEDEALVSAVAATDATVQGELVVLQAMRVDLDGDHQVDRLYVVTVDDDSAQIPRRFSGLLVDWGDGRPVVVQSSGSISEIEHHVSSLSDVDQDGHRELVIDVRWAQGFDTALWRVTPERALERVGGIDCDG